MIRAGHWGLNKGMARAVSAALLLVAAPASADVLEIGASGATWVAGGPARALTAPAVPVAYSDDSVPLTHVADTAGPAAWRAHVAALAVKYDLSPALIDALVTQESGWRTDAVSHAGARGLAQLMPGTASALRVDAANPYANLEGGARYLREQLDRFDGDVEKALAAYNAGPGRVIRAGGVPAIRETQQYVTAIITRLSSRVRSPKP